jgi:L-fucose isomerase-like protein
MLGGFKLASKLNVGFITTVSGRWPKDLPLKRHEEYSAWLMQKYPVVNLIKPEGLAANDDDVNRIAGVFKERAVDLVIILIGAFTGDYAATRLAEVLRVPVVLWAPREPEFNGGRIMANSLVAATMNAAALKRLDADYHFVYGNYSEKRVEEQVSRHIKVYDCIKKLNSTYLGLIGYRPTGFYSSTFDETVIRKTFGIKMEECDLSMLLSLAEKADPAKVEKDIGELLCDAGAADLPEGHLENHCRLYWAMNKLIKEQGFDAVTLKCWPELGQLKYTPCAVISRFSECGTIIGCEGDVDATLTMIIQKYLTGKIPFMCDLVSVDEEQNTALLWHCGQAAESLKNPESAMTIGDHPFAGQGMVFETTLKPGTVTIARMSKIGESYKLFITRGIAMPTGQVTKGVMVNVKLENHVMDMIYGIADAGVPHHYSVVWDDVVGDMKLLCKSLGIDIIKI